MTMVPRGSRLHNSGGHITVSVPLTMKRRNGRKQIIVPEEQFQSILTPSTHQEALVIALARAHRWKRLLDEGTSKSITHIAAAVNLDVSLVARIMRLTLLSPDIVEAILAGEEPDGVSLTRLTKRLPEIWEEQRAEVGMG